MAMGVVSDDELESELKNSSVPATHGSKDIVRPTIINPTNESKDKGRQIGSVEVPESLRKLIGETSAIEGRGEALKFANELGISPSSVSAYAKGANSTASYNEPNEELLGHIIKRKTKRAQLALKVMKLAMNGINDDKIAASSAKELSGIAKDMAGVVKYMEPPDTSNDTAGKQQPQFIVYAPSFVKEENFGDVIYAKE